MPRELGITVEEALSLNGLTEARVVGGRGGLNRVIRYVEVMEVPDILNWVRQDQFLVTTAYSIRDDQEAQERLIPELHKRGLAGLGIKPRRYIEKIPAAMIEAADQLDFPLIELPLDRSFSDILHPILNAIFQKQVAYLRRSEEVHRELMEVVLSGGELVDIASTLAELVGNPVLLSGKRGQVLAFCSGQEDTVSADELLSAGALAEALRVEMQGLFPDLPSHFATEYMEFRGRGVRKITVPVIAGGENYGSITVWELHSSLRHVDVVAIEQSTTVAALKIINQQAIFEVERRYKNEFLHDLLSGDYDSEAAITERGRRVGLVIPLPSSVAVVEISDAQQGRAEVKNSLVYALNSEEITGEGLISGEKGGSLVLVIPEPGGAVAARGKATTLQRLKSLYAYLERTSAARGFAIGVGRTCRSVSELAESYSEAVKALAIRKLLSKPDNVVRFEDMGVYRLLQLLGGSPELQRFVEDTLGRLLEYDREKGTDFLKTLEAFFRCNGNLRRMCSFLFTHYNTVLYRMRRIREITGLDLEDHDQRLNAQVAIKILGLRKVL